MREGGYGGKVGEKGERGKVKKRGQAKEVSRYEGGWDDGLVKQLKEKGG